MPHELLKKTQSASKYGNNLGQHFADVRERKQILSSDIRPLPRNLIIRIAKYTKGRKLVAADDATVQSLVDTAAKNGFKFNDIVLSIASSNRMTQ